MRKAASHTVFVATTESGTRDCRGVSPFSTPRVMDMHADQLGRHFNKTSFNFAIFATLSQQ